MVQAGGVEPLDALGRKQIAVSDQAADDSVRAYPGEDGIELRMQQGLAARDGDERGAQAGDLVDAPVHFFKATGSEKSSYSLQ